MVPAAPRLRAVASLAAGADQAQYGPMEPGVSNAPGEDTIVVGGASPWQSRWNAMPVVARWLLGVATVLAAVAVTGAELAAHTHPHQRTRTVTVPPTSSVVTTDAAGCPVHVRCMPSAASSPAVVRAVRHAFPGATVVSSAATVEAASGRVYRRVVVATDGARTVTVSSQCIPGAEAVPRKVLQGERTFEELDGSTMVLSRTWQVVTPGRTGCSAAVGVDAATSSQAVKVAALALAADPLVQLP